MKLILIDIDNTLLDFDAYIRQTMEEGFAHFGLRPYEPWMYDVFHRENNKLWRQIEEGPSRSWRRSAGTRCSPRWISRLTARCLRNTSAPPSMKAPSP